MNISKRQLQKQLAHNSVLEFIWNSAKANPNWDINTARLLASMHGLDEKLVYRLGREAKVKSIFRAKDWNIHL